MIRMFFGRLTAEKSFARIQWARENSIPILYMYRNTVNYKIESYGDVGPKHFRGSRWMQDNYVPKRNIFGGPGFDGGVMLIRARDATLWTVRWGDEFSDGDADEVESP